MSKMIAEVTKAYMIAVYSGGATYTFDEIIGYVERVSTSLFQHHTKAEQYKAVVLLLDEMVEDEDQYSFDSTAPGSVAQLQNIQTWDDHDEAHRAADKVLCEFLGHLGYQDVVAEWNKIFKWYA